MSKVYIEKNDLGNICHEHLEYYSKSLIYLFETNGFQIIKVEENEINSEVIEFIAKISKSINYRENTSLKATRKFIDRIKKIKSKCFNFVKKEVKKGKDKVMVYGASTKGNTILQVF